ncbi:aldolase [Neobacillus citreus]|uniref:Aldolase n=1 Tax=Neobacillus citreus TaxID=2833578 RepID=A0A942T1J6_9BACI|nr:aldolase [Neobacillus citreus]MCH6266022.1 aldolase [Neobacillus citreus]
MVNTTTKLIYKAFGLHIDSDIFLPELIQVPEFQQKIDVLIKKKDLTNLWIQSKKTHGDYVVKKDRVLFDIPNLAIFMIQGGNEIFFTPFVNSNEGEIRLFILGTCMGAILQQRRILPLHGSAIEIEGKAYAFIGDSGAGKSTLASAFLKSGFRLLTDDVIAISFSENDLLHVVPSYPQQKLWEESLNGFGIKEHNYLPLFSRETKYAVPVHSHFSSKEIPLAGIFELVINKEEEITVQPINRLEGLHKLFYHTYRNFMIEPFGLLQWHLNRSAQLINKIKFFQLSRPTTRFTPDELKTFVLNSLAKGF